MIAKMKVGPKGQVVIPKHFRDDFGLKTGEEVVLDYNGKEVVMKKAPTDIAGFLLAVAKSGKNRKISMKSIRKDYFKQLDDRYARVHR
jgi:AbrB family looped-hinge helix DNA binding protein